MIKLHNRGKASYTEGREVSWDLGLEKNGNATLNLILLIPDDTPLGHLISLKARGECKGDVRCPLGSDDPLTPGVFGDPTIRVVSLSERQVIPSEKVTYPIISPAWV